MHSALILLFVGAAAAAQSQEYVISTFAGGAPPVTPVLGLNMPIDSLQSVAADAIGNTYFIASHCVFKLDPNGVVTRIAGNGRAGYSGDGGPATSAQLRLENVQLAPWDLWVGVGTLPPGITVDRTGNVYVADNGNYRVRRISPDGTITTVVGNGMFGFSGDGGPAISAPLTPVFGLAVDVAGNLLIADSATHRIRRVTSDGRIATVAGTGACAFSGDGGPAVAATMCGPAGIAADTAGNLFITDVVNYRIRQVTPDGTITTVVGSGPGFGTNPWCNPSGDGGPATSAQLCLPSNVAVDQAGNLFVVDTHQNGDCYSCPSYQFVRKISSSGTIATVAGSNCLIGDPYACYKVPGYGTTATQTLFLGPLGIAVDAAGNLFVSDDFGEQYGIPPVPGGPLIYQVSADGAIATAAGGSQASTSIGDGGPAINAPLSSPSGVAVDSAGSVFIADSGHNRIRQVTPDGIIGTTAGNGNGDSSGDGGPAASAQVAPNRITVDGAGNVFFFDLPNRSIRKISRDGMIATLAVIGGNNYFVTADHTGNVFAACSGGWNTLDTVCKIAPNGTARRVAGNGEFGFSGDGGPAISARLAYSDGVAVDSAGNLYIADTQNHRIRKVTADGIISTIAGSSATTSNSGCCSPSQGGFSGDGGSAVEAQLSYPIDVAVDSAGNVFIADWGNNRIRMVTPHGIITTVAGDGTTGYSNDDGPASRAALSGPVALAVDGAGNVYVVDGGNNAIRMLRPVPEHPSAALALADGR
jgi:sugar lactone lactonase YvrE